VPCDLCHGRSEGLDYRRCPKSQTSPDAELCVQLFGHYRNGTLPYAGGWLDQPPILGEVFALVGSEVAAIDQMKSDG
jgi:hypothetical protein